MQRQRQPEMPAAPVRPAPDQGRSSLVNAARVRALAARGVKANIFTSALGDVGYGANASRATLLGQA